MSGSATGDPLLDRMLPTALRLVGGVRMWDATETEGAFADAAALFDDADPATAARALATVCAALVPWDTPPSELVGWVSTRAEFARLIQAGVDPAVAADVCSGAAVSTTTPPTRREE